jgi:hypothetical protein
MRGRVRRLLVRFFGRRGPARPPDLELVEHGRDGSWEATFFRTAVGATTSAVVYAPTPLDAAESAWVEVQARAVARLHLPKLG